jgi:flagellar hook assembly protein FlgD
MNVSLRVYNVSGRLIRTLVSGSAPAGPSTVTWDGRDSAGGRVSSGVYFYRLDNGQRSLTRKGVLLR